MIIGLLPYHKRLPKRIAFLRAFAAILESMVNGLKNFRKEGLQLAYTNCQRFRLEKHLNDVFDAEQRRILITEIEGDSTVIGFESETEFITIGFESEVDYFNVFGFQGEQEYVSNQITIIAPATINSNMLLDETNKFKLAGIKVLIVN